MRSRDIAIATLVLQFASSVTLGQAAKPLTNPDIVKMVKGGLPESVVISAIQSSPAKYDISPDALLALQKDGVTAKEMDAILAESKKSPASTPVAGGADATSSPKGHLPRVMMVKGKAAEPLGLEKTQLAQTRTKPSSMKSLAGDTALNQAMQAGIGTAAWSTATHMNSGIGGASVLEGGSILSGVMARRKPMMTYVWGVTNVSSKTVLQTTLPEFSLDLSNTMGVHTDDFEPAIVKLTPAQNSYRIVGATQGKEDMQSNTAADWEIYSSFLEDRVAVKSQKVKPGVYHVSPASPLLPGEYALVLRPVSKSKKFSGGDVARAQGDGLLFDAVWSFQVADSAE